MVLLQLGEILRTPVAPATVLIATNLILFYVFFSYVMKLFDRSVDFAKYNEETPLYVLARSWMQNKPHTTKTADSHASTSQEKEAPGQEGLQPADGEVVVICSPVVPMVVHTQ